jgi:hypothetical protein
VLRYGIRQNGHAVQVKEKVTESRKKHNHNKHSF